MDEGLNSTPQIAGSVASLSVHVANINVVEAGLAVDALRIEDILVRRTRYIAHAEVGIKSDRILIFKQT